MDDERLDQRIEIIGDGNVAGNGSISQVIKAGSGSTVSGVTQVAGDYYAAPPTPVSAAAPALQTRFFGRQVELDALTRAFTTSDTPQVIIALQGMGGVGKTATALELAAELSPQLPGGVFWGSLPTYNGNPRPILRNWARICSQNLSAEADPNALADLVRGLLAGRQANSGPLLAIIDDVRPEWLDAAQILKRAVPAGTPLLLTTRDETLVAALGADIHRLDALPADESLDLLKAHTGATVVEANPAEAEALLQAVGHLPLAIELAGKRLALLARKPGYRLETLRQTVEEQATQALSLPGHPSLAATFAVTYEALPTEAQRLFRWLGAFASSPLKVPAVAGVMDLRKIETESALDELVLVSLLDWGEMEGTYIAHPLLHQYAQISLAEAGEAKEAGQKHLAYYLTFAQANAQAEPGAWDRLEEGLPNLSLAAKRAAETGDSAAIVALEEALLHDSLFLNVRGYYQEAVDLFSQSLEVQKSLGLQRNQPRTMNKLAWFCMRLGQYEKAQRHAEAAFSLAVAFGDQGQQADSFRYQGMIFSIQGSNERALERFKKELAIRRDSGDPTRMASCLNNLGVLELARGNYVETRRYFDGALAVCDKAGDKKGIAMYIGNRGIPSLYLGDYTGAMKDFETALDQSRELGDRENIARNLLNTGMVQSYLGDYSLSLQSLQDALPLWQEMGDKADEVLTLITLAEVYSVLGDEERAVEYLQTADVQIRDVGKREVELEYLSTLGAVHYEQGDCEGALAACLQMEALAEETGLKYFLVQSKLGLSRTCLAQSGREDLENARHCAEEAINLCQKLQLAGDEPRGHAYLGKANLLLGDKETALQNCREAMRLLDEQKHVRGLEAEIHLMTIQVLAANGLEGERWRYLEQAYDMVQATAAKIKDGALRQSYLAVPVNREIAETWARENESQAAYARLKPSR